MRHGDAKRLLRSEMVRRGVDYDALQTKLAEIGVEETNASLRNKVSRGAFTADFLLSALTAMGVTNIRLGE